MDNLTYWIWVYRIAIIGIASILTYSCGKTIRNMVGKAKEIRKLKKEICKLKKEIRELIGENSDTSKRL